MFFKTFSQLFLRFFSNYYFFIFKKAKVCMYKADSFPNMPENSDFNSIIKVRRLVKQAYLHIWNASIYLQRSNEFLKN